MLGALGALLFPVACISENYNIKKQAKEYRENQLIEKPQKLKRIYEQLISQGKSPENAKIIADIVIYGLYHTLVTPSEQAQIDKYKVMGYM